jgi:hypothetical protein
MEYRYRPWVGKNYNKSNVFGTKLLILGESHYGYDKMDDGEPEVLNATNTLIVNQLNNIRERFLTNLFNICNTGKITEQKFWDSVVFYNYIQLKDKLMGPGQRPTQNQWKDSEELFISTIKKYQPDKILVLGKELWFKLPDAGGVDGPYKYTWCYSVSKTKNALATYVYHPSRYSNGLGARDSRKEFVRLLKMNTK